MATKFFVQSNNGWSNRPVLQRRQIKQRIKIIVAPGKGTPFSPGIAPPEPSIEPPSSASPDRPIEPSQQAKNSTSASNELKRMVRVMVGVLLVGVVLGAVWQTYRDEQTRNLIKDWRHSSMSWLSYSFSATQRDSESSAQSSTKLSDQAAQRPTGASVQADEVADLKQQLLAVVNDLAIMRRVSKFLASMSSYRATLRRCKRPNRMLAKRYLHLLSLRLHLLSLRAGSPEKTSRRLSARSLQSNQTQHLSRPRPHRLERNRSPSSRLVPLCQCQPLLKHLRPSIDELGLNGKVEVRW